MAAPGAIVADRYRLVRQLGAGGMGVVWEARDERLDRVVAVKQLRTQPGLTDGETEVIAQRAMREARISASLQHPYAVSVFDVVEDEGKPCIVMELVPSVPLSEVTRELGALSPAEAARVGSQVAAALAEAHAQGIVHRDVKPGNILIGDDGAARICDFGISRALGDATLTMTGMITGTPAYLAPEVARGEEASYPSDVYSLGATLYSAVEGEPPFGTDGNAIAVLYRVTSGTMRPPERAGALAPLLLAMMSPEPQDRPSMAEASTALSTLATGAAGRPAGLPDRTFPLQVPKSGSGPSPADTPPMPYQPYVSGSPDQEPPNTVPVAPVEPVQPPRVTATPPASEPTRVPMAAPGRPTSSTAPVTRTPRRRRPALIATIVVVIALAVIAAVTLLRPLLDDPTTGSSPDSGAGTTPTASSAADGPTAEQLAQAVSDYYALLPDDTDAAWGLLTPSYQQQSGGRDSYERFWNGMDTVTATDVRGTTPDRAQATITYVQKSGNQRSVERRSYRLVESDGTLKINQSSVI